MSEKGKLIVLAAFDRSEDGNLVPAFEPRQFETADLALQEALGMADRHVGVIAWMRDADPYLGEGRRQCFSRMAISRNWNERRAEAEIQKHERRTATRGPRR